jgi:regulator of RNase E activity RraB
MKDSEIPNDADGDTMRRVIAGGSDISRPMKIDFHIAAPNEEAAEKIASVVKQRGFEMDSYYDRDRGGLTCSCSRTMILSHSGLLHVQEELSELSGPHGGHTDGWGTFGNKEEANQAPEPTAPSGRGSS